ncbi:MARVEL domain-containing protein 3 [Oryzias melastigma]|uniref:Si:ch211-191a24.4 n=1 Tax=Oryzias melastigma TaxID=30732 RepID=A0A3B3DKK0_ORYME|nr:MARVEL domain-containing protein 3 [Oryzias melastigma]
MSHPSRPNREYRDRDRDRGDRDRERGDRDRDRGDRDRDRRDRDRSEASSQDNRSSQPPYYPSDSNPRPRSLREVRHTVHQSSSKCSNICSRRGIVLICAVLTNALVLICVVSAQMVMSGMSSMGGFSSFDINTNFNLQGTELQQVRELDMQFSQMRAPGIYGGVAFSLTFGVISLLFVVAGSKPPHLMSQKLLRGAFVFQALGAVLYVVAVGLYLHFVIDVNSTDVCKRRERIYARNGYTWMNCNVGGADAAVALFGLITAILYTAGAVFTFQTIRRVSHFFRDRKKREEEKRKGRSHTQDSPLRAGTTHV